jgi:hypothetical protein
MYVIEGARSSTVALARVAGPSRCHTATTVHIERLRLKFQKHDERHLADEPLEQSGVRSQVPEPH